MDGCIIRAPAMTRYFLLSNNSSQAARSFFQLCAGALQEGAHHVGDAALEFGAEACCTDEAGHQVQFARVLAAQFDALHDLDEHTRAVLFKLRDVAQEVAAL